MKHNGRKNATGYNRPADFFRALARGVASGRGFRLAYTGPGDVDLFEDVCAAVWEILDGNKTTHFVAEEYGAACEGPGPIQIRRHPNHKRLWQEGRKYGLQWHATSQRPQSISKDAVENVGAIWAGSMGLNAAKRIGQEIDLRPEEIRAVQPGNFWYWTPSKPAEAIHVFTPRTV